MSQSIKDTKIWAISRKLQIMLFIIAFAQANIGAHGLTRSDLYILIIHWTCFVLKERLVPNFLHMVVSWKDKALTILEAACIKSFLIYFNPGWLKRTNQNIKMSVYDVRLMWNFFQKPFMCTLWISVWITLVSIGQPCTMVSAVAILLQN